MRFLFLYNASHFDRKCCKSHLSLSLRRFVQVHNELRLIYVKIDHLKTFMLLDKPGSYVVVIVVIIDNLQKVQANSERNSIQLLESVCSLYA